MREAHRGGQRWEGTVVRGGLVTGTDPNKVKSDQTLSSVSCVVNLPSDLKGQRDLRMLCVLSPSHQGFSSSSRQGTQFFSLHD